MLINMVQQEDSCPRDKVSHGPECQGCSGWDTSRHLPTTHPPTTAGQESATSSLLKAVGPAHCCFVFCFQCKSHFTPKLRQNIDGLFQHLLAQTYRKIGTALRGPSIPCFNLAFSCHVHPIIPAPSKGKANWKHLHPEMHTQSDFHAFLIWESILQKGLKLSLCTTVHLSLSHQFTSSFSLFP